MSHNSSDGLSLESPNHRLALLWDYLKLSCVEMGPDTGIVEENQYNLEDQARRGSISLTFPNGHSSDVRLRSEAD